MNPQCPSVVQSPDAAQVRAALDRVVASDIFRASPQLAAFLKFVVQAVLDGEGTRLKGYTIGVEAFGRPGSFDAQQDPIVRVEATRLRRALERYYAGDGAADTVVIELPRGSYAPTLRFRDALATVDAGRATADAMPTAPVRLAARGRIKWRWVLLPAAALVLVTAGVFAPRVRLDWSRGPDSSAARPASPITSEALRPGNGLPTLLVAPFETAGTAGARDLSAASLHDRISDAFARFDLVNVLWEPMTEPAAQPASPNHADYRLIGVVDYRPGAFHLQFRLIDTADGTVVWSRLFEERSGDRDIEISEDAIVRELATTLVQPFGVIFAHEERRAATAVDPRFHCLLETIESFRSFSPAQTEEARACLERFTARDPGFALGWSYLAAIDLRAYLYRLSIGGGDRPPLERALRSARRGVELDPASARAHEMLFAALFARHDLAAAFAAGEKAMDLNRYDMRTVGAYGARKVAVGDIDEGMKLLQLAGGDGTVVPDFEQFFQFVGSYMRNDFERASFHAGQLTGDSFQLGLIARALDAFHRHDAEGTRMAFGRLNGLNPMWRQDTRAELQKFFYAAPIVDRLALDLGAAGLAQAP
jgi:TolB-like protein